MQVCVSVSDLHIQYMELNALFWELKFFFFFFEQLDGKEATATTDEQDENDFFEEAHALPTHIDHHHQS